VVDAMTGSPGVRTASGPSAASGASVSHGPALILQPTGRPVPTTTNPNVVAAPGVRSPFQLALLNVRCWPDVVSTESQLLEILEPAGRSKVTVQRGRSPGPSLVIVYCAW
jgi:hypothetical protein